MKSHAPMTVDAVITVPPSLPALDAPTAIRRWLTNDSDWVAGPHVWRACFVAMKPGAHLVCIADTVSADLLSLAIRLSGFELRDVVGYAHDDGDEIGWTPIILARRPLHGTVTENVIRFGTGALNIDAGRIGTSRPPTQARAFTAWRRAEGRSDLQVPVNDTDTEKGRWPANVVHDASPQVIARFDSFGERQGGQFPAKAGSLGLHGIYGRSKGLVQDSRDMDSGSIARYFRQAPDLTAVVEWLRVMVCPPNAVVLDPFEECV